MTSSPVSMQRVSRREQVSALHAVQVQPPCQSMTQQAMGAHWGAVAGYKDVDVTARFLLHAAAKRAPVHL